MIHLDPEKPENHNVNISNLKNGYIMVYDGIKWDTKNRDEIIADMIDDKQGLIEERIEIWIERGEKYPSIMKKFERYLEKKENNKVINKIKEEIKFMLYNNKSLMEKRQHKPMQWLNVMLFSFFCVQTHYFHYIYLYMYVNIIIHS